MTTHTGRPAPEIKQAFSQEEFAPQTPKVGYSVAKPGSIWRVWIDEGGGFLEEC